MLQRAPAVVVAAALAAAGAVQAQSSAAAEPPPLPASAAARLDALQRRLAEQLQQLADMKKALADQEASLNAVRRALDDEARAAAVVASRPAVAPVPAVPQPAAALAAPQSSAAVAASPSVALPAAQTAVTAPPPAPVTTPAAVAASPVPSPSPLPAPPVAPIFEQPSVLTPAGSWVLEPSLQYAYSSSTRIALVGYTVIPALLVGLVDVREVKRSTTTGALAVRHGLSNRFELEAKLPYVARSDTSVGREVLQGASSDSSIFNARGRGVGDAEVTGRWQLNQDSDSRYLVGSLRVKTRTGKDPFQVPVSTSVQGFRGDGVQTELPTGSGFWAIQPALTVLVPSDPAVFFGSVSYLHSVRRNTVMRNTDQGPQLLGSVAPGGIVGFNVGMGLALNEKSSFSLGYDHSAVGRTRLNGNVAPDSVPLQLGTLLLGLSYRLDERRTLNLSLGAGLTRDTPDVTLTLRIPTTF